VARSNSEREKIPPQSIRGVGRYCRIEEQANELLSGAQHFASTRATPSVIGSGQVEKRERAGERVIEPGVVSFLSRANGALDLTAGVGQLFDKTEARPSEFGR
jgi:hypothetical protein